MRKNLICLNILLGAIVAIVGGVNPVYASTQLIGSTNDECPSIVSNGYVVAGKFTAVATGVGNVFRIRTTNNGNIESAVYTDVAGVPTALLCDTVSSAVTGGAYSDITFDNCSLTSGTTYWLAENSDATDPCYTGSGGTAGYFSRTFGTGFPGTFPAYSSANWDVKYQVWASTTPSTATATVLASTFDDQTLILLIMLVLAFYAFIVHIHGRFYPKKLPYKV